MPTFTENLVPLAVLGILVRVFSLLFCFVLLLFHGRSGFAPCFCMRFCPSIFSFMFAFVCVLLLFYGGSGFHFGFVYVIVRALLFLYFVLVFVMQFVCVSVPIIRVI
jgi:hypothetical protein